MQKTARTRRKRKNRRRDVLYVIERSKDAILRTFDGSGTQRNQCAPEGMVKMDRPNFRSLSISG